MFMRRPTGYTKWGQIKNIFAGLYEWVTHAIKLCIQTETVFWIVIYVTYDWHIYKQSTSTPAKTREDLWRSSNEKNKKDAHAPPSSQAGMNVA